MIPSRAAERAATRYVVDESGCWISTYSVGSHGYAQVGWQQGDLRNMTTAHRAAWTFYNGPIPDGLTVDHICHVRRCVNPAHLRLLTRSENGADNRMAEFRVHPTTTKLCRRGLHPMAAAGKQNYCRECKAERQRRYRKQRQETGATNG
jgi:hypothetical protein